MTEQFFNSGVQSQAASNPAQQLPKSESISEFPSGASSPSNSLSASSPTGGVSGPVTTPGTAPTPSNNPQMELKTKRIKVLRILAIKAASILDWNLIKFEAE